MVVPWPGPPALRRRSCPHNRSARKLDAGHYRPHIANPTGTRNTGQLPKYIITDHHQPIISRAIYDAVQTELARRRASGGRALTPTGGTNALTHRIHCTTCGCGSPQIVEGLRLRGVRDGRRGGLLVI
ncbi:MAG: hypothetical protein E7E98_06370, partial [Cutibacterium avidum]|nr:hypothetical protein [Cutibacterium avidum]